MRLGRVMKNSRPVSVHSGWNETTAGRNARHLSRREKEIDHLVTASVVGNGARLEVLPSRRYRPTLRLDNLRCKCLSIQFQQRRRRCRRCRRRRHDGNARMEELKEKKCHR